MKTSDFDYYLPPELIAQVPVEPRDSSRLLILDRSTGHIKHKNFYNLPEYLTAGDTLVFNDSRVIPARLFGVKSGNNTRIELLLLRHLEENIWESLAKPARKITTGTKLKLSKKDDAGSNVVDAEIIDCKINGIRIIRISNENLLSELGIIPLPPYIHQQLLDAERYQTVYARISGSVAAPTAGLHFTPGLLNELQQKGIQFAFVTLHIGLDTFQPVRVLNPEQHPIHSEYGKVNSETATMLNRAIMEKRRIIAVGTSTARIIEAASISSHVKPLMENINLFILPGYKFKITDAMITNFHIPQSTLLMLVSAFAGKDRIMDTYRQAINLKYRFYSFGDSMLII